MRTPKPPRAPVPPAVGQAPPAGHYQLDKSHAKRAVPASVTWGSRATRSRFSRVDSELTFDPDHIAAATVVTTIDATSLEMDAAPALCLDIAKARRSCSTLPKFPQIIFRSEKVRMTGCAGSMETMGTLNGDVHGVTPAAGAHRRRLTAATRACRRWIRMRASGFPLTARSSVRILEWGSDYPPREPPWDLGTRSRFQVEAGVLSGAGTGERRGITLTGPAVPDSW